MYIIVLSIRVRYFAYCVANHVSVSLVYFAYCAANHVSISSFMLSFPSLVANHVIFSLCGGRISLVQKSCVVESIMVSYENNKRHFPIT